MAFTLSSDIEDALWRAAERTLPAHVLRGRVLASAIIERSRRYTSERALRDFQAPAGNQTRDAADAAAHALFFTVCDAPKVTVPLAELDGRGLLSPGDGPITILDLGAGAGAMSLGIVDYLHTTGRLDTRPVVIHAVDRDQRALEIMGRAVADIADRFHARIALTVECADITGQWTASALTRADLVVAGSVLNELEPDERLAAVQRMLAHTDEEGALIVIEPALRETARALHRVRDAIIEAGSAHVFAPCTSEARGCPMLDDPDDWCHEDRRTDLPARAARLAAATGLRTHGLKFSYLVLRHDATAQVAGLDPVDERVALRLVAQPERSKGKRECLACGDAGLVTIRLLRKNRGTDKRGFERTRRGDVVVAPARLVGGGDIERADTIQLVSIRTLKLEQPPGR